MKGLCFLLLVFGSIISAGQEQSKPVSKWTNGLDSLYGTFKGKDFPGFDVQLHDGSRLNTDSIKRKVFFASFWFEWCNPCRAEFDGFNELYDSLKGNKNFAFVAFTYEHDSIVKRIVKENKLRYPIASITKKECERLKMLGGYPINIVTNREGKIVYFKLGGVSEPEKATKYIKAAIAPVIDSLLKL